MKARETSPEDAWRAAQNTGQPILDLRTRAERRKFGYPPGSIKVSFFWHSLAPKPNGIYLCQHAVRSKLPAARGATEIAGGFVAWEAHGLPVQGRK